MAAAITAAAAGAGDLGIPRILDGNLFTCGETTISWTGGISPVRVEAFYQRNASDSWRSTGTLPSEAASGQSVKWVANVPAGSTAWITLVDHSGKYRQSTVGTLVQASGNTSCLDAVQTASVVTQTVFMAPDTGSAVPVSDSLDNKSLLIVAVVFGVLFFAAMSGLVYTWSRIRQMRRLRQVGPDRFPLADDASSIYDTSSMHRSSGYVAGGVVRSQHPASAGMSQRMSYRDTSGALIASGAIYSRRVSNASEMASLTASPGPLTPYQGDDFDVHTPRSAVRHAFDANPFNDPASPTLSSRDSRVRTLSGATAVPTSPLRSSHIRSTSAGLSTLQRPIMPHSATETASLASATSMQIFGTSGPLRIANDAGSISTPNLSRESTRTDRQTDTYASIPLHTAATQDSYGYRRNDTAEGRNRLLSSAASSYSGHSEVTTSTGTMSTSNDHYAATPHSSKAHMSPTQKSHPTMTVPK